MFSQLYLQTKQSKQNLLIIGFNAYQIRFQICKPLEEFLSYFFGWKHIKKKNLRGFKASNLFAIFFSKAIINKFITKKNFDMDSTYKTFVIY
jgi:hypothetical protein